MSKINNRVHITHCNMYAKTHAYIKQLFTKLNPLTMDHDGAPAKVYAQ
jgi:hypothetical protein